MAYVITAQNDNDPCPGWVLDIVSRQRRVFRMRFGRNSSLNDHEVFQAWDYATSLDQDTVLTMEAYELAKIDNVEEWQGIVTHHPRMNFLGDGHPA